MDPYNLAICFGPTLLRVPSHRDPVQHHPHIVELVRNILIHQEDIFIGDDLLSDGSTYYERCFIEEEEGCVVLTILITCNIKPYLRSTSLLLLAVNPCVNGLTIRIISCTDSHAAMCLKRTVKNVKFNSPKFDHF